MLLHVTHETRYAYSPAVETAQHLAHLKPRATPSQRLVSHALTVSPEPAQRSESPDVYGNARAFFALADNHGVVLRGLQRDDESLEEMFHRVINTD